MTRDRREMARAAPVRVGVLGAAGQLGRCLVREIEAAADLTLAFAATRAEIDVGDVVAIGPWLDSLTTAPGAGVDVVVNAAAMTAVDVCESEVERAHRVNGLAPAAWARALSERGIRFMHISTDYVFAGDGTRPYREEDPTDPRSVYGASKLEGEQGVLAADPHALVVRTSWVFGPGRNFVVAILEQARKRRSGEAEGPLRVVDDQRGRPTYAADLALALLVLARRMTTGEEPTGGILHLCNRGETTWYGFAREALAIAGYPEIAIDPVPTSAFPTPATRPAYSVLDCSRAARLGLEMRDWSEALAGYLRSPDRPKGVLGAGPERSDEASTGMRQGGQGGATAGGARG
jgi:dTDP-4-dehydrorhamnose reductase